MFNWFVANLVRTLYAKFYQNQPRLVEDITQAFWFTFLGRCMFCGDRWYATRVAF